MSALTDEQLDQQLWAQIRLEELPRTRNEARSQGSSRYFTGKPCAQGHFAARKTSDRTCVGCQNRYQQRYREGRREQTHAYNRKYRQAHRDELNFKRKLYDVYGTTRINEIRMLAV